MRIVNERTAAGRARDGFVAFYRGNGRLKDKWKIILQRLTDMGPEPDPKEVVDLSEGKIKIPPLECDECKRQCDELVEFDRHTNTNEMFEGDEQDFEDYYEGQYFAGVCAHCLLKAMELINP